MEFLARHRGETYKGQRQFQLLHPPNRFPGCSFAINKQSLRNGDVLVSEQSISVPGYLIFDQAANFDEEVFNNEGLWHHTEANQLPQSMTERSR